MFEDLEEREEKENNKTTVGNPTYRDLSLHHHKIYHEIT